MRSIPKQGQLVIVRQRLYVITDVHRSLLPPELSPSSRAQHVVTLASIEDDALGEELQVVWEIEPGAQVFEKMELPEPKGFDRPAHLEAFLDAVRWGAASVADTHQLQYPFRSGIDIESYQSPAPRFRWRLICGKECRDVQHETSGFQARARNLEGALRTR